MPRFSESIAALAAALAKAQAELDEHRKLVQADRERIKLLHHRLKQRFHHRCSAESRQISDRETAVKEQQHRLDARPGREPWT